jgi:hypothetical protein
MVVVPLAMIACYLRDIAKYSLIPTVLFILVTIDASWWRDLVAWWRPWSDATLFAALTTLVHETLYFGTPLCRCHRCDEPTTAIVLQMFAAC